MVDHEAVVEISAGGRTFKVSGSEKFVEKLLRDLPVLYPITIASAEQTNDQSEALKTDGERTHETIDDFVTRLKIANSTPEVQKVSAFVYYLTEIRKKATCTSSEVEECFDLTGLKTPENLRTQINNAGKATHGGYLRAVTRGSYAPTTNGKNLVKRMAQGS